MDLDSALTGKAAESAGALEMLRDDHGEIRRLVAQYRAAENESAHARHVLIEAIAMQAELHTRIEDEVFYPAVRALCPEFVDQARETHGAMAAKIDALQAFDPGEAEYGEIAEQLIAALSEHMDEEERALFVEAERRMSAELRALGGQIMRRKEQLTRSVEDFEGPAT